MTDRGARLWAPVARPALLAAILLVAAGACVPTSPPPTALGVPSPSVPQATEPAMTVLPTNPTDPSPTEPAAAAAPPCEPFDVKASHGLVESLAGARTTEVVLVAAVRCSVDAVPRFGLVDAGGGSLVLAAATGADRIDLEPEVAYRSDARIASWCAPEPAFPVSLVLALAVEGEVTVTGSSFPEDGNLPDCVGAAAPTVDVSPWTPTG